MVISPTTLFALPKKQGAMDHVALSFIKRLTIPIKPSLRFVVIGERV